MANQLTGDFDAVVQIAARQINGLLATLHQNGASSGAALRLLHSARLRIGDPGRPRPEVVSFGDWVLELQRAAPPRNLPELVAEVASTAPPGVVKRLQEALAGLDDLPVFEQPTSVVRGTADVQVSTPTVSVPTGSTSEVTIHADVRAHYRPDPNTDDLPAPVHGEVATTFDVRIMPAAGGRRLVIRPSADDTKIRFVPAPTSGLDLVEASRIAAEIRKVLRSGLTLLPVDLPPEFPFDAFKGVGAGSTHALALGVQLSGVPAPPNAIQGVSQSVVGPSGFAFAVRKEFVNTMIDLEAIREAIKQQRIRVRFDSIFGSFTIVYRLRFSSGPTLTFRPGAIDVSGRIAVETDTPVASTLASGFVEFKQPIRLVLDTTTQRVGLERIGEPEVDESWFIPHQRAVTAVRSQMESALASSAAPVRKVFDDARQNLRGGLQTFDQSAVPRYAAVEITVDGIIVRGDVATAPRPVPVVDVRDTTDGTAFTAFQSWIPGGRLDRFVWSWVEYSGPAASVFSGVTRTHVDADRFLLPKPPGITTRSSICLRTEGVLLSAGGVPISVAGGTTCVAPVIGPVLNIPAWFDPVTVPVWRPDIAAHVAVKSAISAHISVQSVRADRDASRQNTLVYFADWRPDAPLGDLGAALSRIERCPPGLALIIVVPVGTFEERRRELERKLAPITAPFAGHLHITEDDERGWTRTFAPASVPAVFLVNARRQLVWRQDGTLEGDDLAAALTRFVDPAPPLEATPLRLVVGIGDPAPDAVFDDERGDGGAIHRFLGRRVWLTFWQGWSSASLNELRRLQSLSDRAEREGTSILAFHGGNQKYVDQIRRQLGISFPLIPDPEHRVASTYGVRCWPTTVTVDQAGRIEHIQFGTASDHGRATHTVERSA